MKEQEVNNKLRQNTMHKASNINSIIVKLRHRSLSEAEQRLFGVVSTPDHRQLTIIGLKGRLSKPFSVIVKGLVFKIKRCMLMIVKRRNAVRYCIFALLCVVVAMLVYVLVCLMIPASYIERLSTDDQSIQGVIRLSDGSLSSTDERFLKALTVDTDRGKVSVDRLRLSMRDEVINADICALMETAENGKFIFMGLDPVGLGRGLLFLLGQSEAGGSSLLQTMVGRLLNNEAGGVVFKLTKEIPLTIAASKLPDDEVCKLVIANTISAQGLVGGAVIGGSLTSQVLWSQPIEQLNQAQKALLVASLKRPLSEMNWPKNVNRAHAILIKHFKNQPEALQRALVELDQIRMPNFSGLKNFVVLARQDQMTSLTVALPRYPDAYRSSQAGMDVVWRDIIAHHKDWSAKVVAEVVITRNQKLMYRWSNNELIALSGIDHNQTLASTAKIVLLTSMAESGKAIPDRACAKPAMFSNGDAVPGRSGGCMSGASAFAKSDNLAVLDLFNKTNVSQIFLRDIVDRYSLSWQSRSESVDPAYFASGMVNASSVNLHALYSDAARLFEGKPLLSHIASAALLDTNGTMAALKPDFDVLRHRMPLNRSIVAKSGTDEANGINRAKLGVLAFSSSANDDVFVISLRLHDNSCAANACMSLTHLLPLWRSSINYLIQNVKKGE